MSEEPIRDEDQIDIQLVELSSNPSAPVESTVRMLHSELETLAESLKTPLPPDPFEEESACVRSVERAKSLAKELAESEVASTNASAKAIPEWLEHFRILQLLGEGGMGAVYLAEDTRLGRKVALKTMRSDLAAKLGAKERFLREARLVAGLEHDHIVPIYHVGEAEGIPYLAMPLLKGQSLEELIKLNKKLAADDVIRLGIQIAAGLSAAHNQGLIHRDIKPGNLWIEPIIGGRVKILDFGLARSNETDTSLTQSGTLLGTPAYMAPEQARGEKVDARADLYSLGVVLYRLATGEFPLKGTDTMSMLTSLATQAPRPAHEFNAEVPVELSVLIMRLLAKDPNQRPDSALMVMQELESLQQAPAVVSIRKPEPATGTKVEGGASAHEAIAQPQTLAGGRGSGRWRRWPTVAALFLLALLPLGYFLGGTIVRIATNQGELVVEIDDPAVEIAVMQNGIVVQDKTTKREFTLAAGEGQIDVFEKDGIKLATREFSLTRGGATTVKVTLQEIANARTAKTTSSPSATPPANEEPTMNSTAADAERLAAAYVLSIGGEVQIDDSEKWIKAAELQEFSFSHAPHTPIDTANFLKYLPNHPVRLTGVRVTHSMDPAMVINEKFAHFKDCKHLKQLYLYLNQVNDRGLANFKDCKGLSHLEIYNRGWSSNGSVTDAGLANFKNCKDLIHLSLSCDKVTDAGLAHFKDCKDLIHLSLECIYVTDAGLAQFKDCKHLTHLSLNIYNKQITDAGLAQFKDCKHLTHLSLNIYNKQITDAGLAQFKDCKHLTHLSLNIYNKQITDAGLAQFKDCKHLTHLSLNIYNKQITDAGLAQFKDCKHLTHLSLNIYNKQITDAGLAHFKDCKELTHLSLFASDATYGGLGLSTDMSDLQHLSRSDKKLTTAGLAYFEHCKSLKMLQLGGDLATDAGLAYFKDCNELLTLDLSDSDVTDAGLANFRDCKNLTYLNLMCTFVTDEGLANFKECKNLSNVDLYSTRLTDASVEVLAKLSSLQGLVLNNTRISLCGYEELSKTLPKCDIIWTEPNRKLAELVLSAGGGVEIGFRGQPSRVVTSLSELPNDLFQVRKLSIKEVGQPNDHAVNLRSSDFLNLFYDLSFEEFDRLEKLDISNCRELLSGHFYNRLERTIGLEELLLANLRIEDLEMLPKLKSLKRLVLDGNPLKSLAPLAKLSNLEELSLANTGLTDESLSELPSLPLLRRLILDGNNISGPGLHILKNLPALVDLSLACPNLTDAAMKQIAEFTQLKRLSLAGSGFDDAEVQPLEGLKQLEWLDFRSTRVTGTGLAALKNCKGLTHLFLDGTRVRDTDLASFPEWQGLKSLGLGGTRVSDIGLAHLKNCRELTQLILDNTRVTDLGLAELESFPSLQHLTLLNSRISQSGYEKFMKVKPECQVNWSEPNRLVAERVLAIGGMVEVGARGEPAHPIKSVADLPKEPFQVRTVSLAGVKNPLENLTDLISQLRSDEFDRLEKLDLSGFKGQNYSFLVTIAGLEELSLANAGLTDESLKELPRLPLLRRLILDGNEIRGPGIAALNTQPALIDLSLGCPSLTDLAAGKLVEHLRQFRRLSLAGSGLGDAGIKHFEGLTNLEWLDLRETDVSSAGIERLQKALPECRIDWVGVKQ